MFKPLLLVPLYNHLSAFKLFSSELKKTNVPVLVIDDGSSDGKAVQAFCVKMGFLYRRHEQNRGKGAALKTGLREAHILGFTHALQIDADGQHSAEDIPKFLKESFSHQKALINGVPLYDEQAPKSRVWGRKITNFWVGVETHSFHFGDAMCGFRVYPLRQIEPFLDELKAERMGGDIEILVQAMWHKIMILPVKTCVFYPVNGISHFRVWTDNLRLSGLHARLFFLSLWRMVWKLH